MARLGSGRAAMRLRQAKPGAAPAASWGPGPAAGPGRGQRHPPPDGARRQPEEPPLESGDGTARASLGRLVKLAHRLSVYLYTSVILTNEGECPDISRQIFLAGAAFPPAPADLAAGQGPPGSNLTASRQCGAAGRARFWNYRG